MDFTNSSFFCKVKVRRTANFHVDASENSRAHRCNSAERARCHLLGRSPPPSWGSSSSGIVIGSVVAPGIAGQMSVLHRQRFNGELIFLRLDFVEYNYNLLSQLFSAAARDCRAFALFQRDANGGDV